MEHLIGYTEPQLNTNQKRPWQGALADSHERACFVDICMIPPCQDLGKGDAFPRETWYNSANIKATPVGAGNASRGLTLTGGCPMSAHSNLPHSSTFSTPELQPDRHIVSVINADGVNILFDPPIACTMRDPDNRLRDVHIGDTDALVALVFAGWTMVEVA